MYSNMLVILDYSTGEVKIIRMDLKNKTTDDIEKYIESIGHRLKDVSYMITTNDKIILDIIETTGKEKKPGKYKITSKAFRKPVYCDNLKVLDYK